MAKSVASTNDQDSDGTYNNEDAGSKDGNRPEDSTPDAPPTACKPEKKDSLAAEFALVSLGSYLCGAMSLWLFHKKCAKKTVPTAPAASVVEHVTQARSIAVVPVSKPHSAEHTRLPDLVSRYPKLFPPPPPPPRRRE